MTVGWPLLFPYFVGSWSPPTHIQGLFLASPVPAIVLLLFDTHPENMIAEIVWWSTFWDVIFILLALVVTALAIWTLDRRSRAYTSRPRDVEGGQPVIETVLVID